MHGSAVDFAFDLRGGKPDRINLRLADFVHPADRIQSNLWSLRSLVQAVFVPWVPAFLYCDLAHLVDCLPDLSVDLRTFLCAFPVWQQEAVCKVHLFTDGSAGLGESAAWSLVILYEVEVPGQSASSFRFRGAGGALLRGLSEWIGRGSSVGEMVHDSLSAEHVGLIWALGWALQDCHQFPIQPEYHFHFDNVSAGFGMLGTWTSPATPDHQQLGLSATYLRQLLSAVSSVYGHHVKAHDGMPWNCLADGVAKALSKQILPQSELPSSVPDLLHHPQVAHAWIELQSHLDVRSSVHWPSLFRIEGPSNPLAFDSHWSPPSDTHLHTTPVCLNLRIGTANVLTLGYGTQEHQRQGRLFLGRVGYLRQQFAACNLHLLSLQETRSAGQLTRHNSEFLVYQSGCDPAGTHGIELWLSRTQPYGHKGKKALFFAPAHVTVLAFHPRYLLVELNAPALQCHFLCVHAPFSTSLDCSPVDFWSLVDSSLKARQNMHWPLVVAGDYNSRLGSIQSSAVSSHQAEEQNDCGEYAHEFLLRWDLCLPSTFRFLHTGDGPTWTVGAVGQSRLDYIAVPAAWLDSVTNSCVHLDVDLLTDNDHQLVTLDLSLLLRDQWMTVKQHTRPCPRKLKNPGCVRSFLADVRSLTSIPWTFGVGHHCELLTSKLQALVRQHFSVEQKQPYRPHFSETTWGLVLVRHTLLRIARHIDLLQKRLCGQLHLRAWFQCFCVRRGVLSTVASSLESMLNLQSARRLLKCDVLVLRCQMQGPTRRSSRRDRQCELQRLADRFSSTASLANPRELYRLFQPLVGSLGRKPVFGARPLPAIRLPSGQLARSGAELATVWQSHFASLEGGQPIDASTLQQLATAFSQSSPVDLTSISLDFGALPTLQQVEAVIRRSKPFKAPGPDSLPSTLYRLDPVLFARLLYPLYLKTSIRCFEPLRFRGGEVFALAKRVHTQFECSSFRSIVLTDQMAKYHHTIQRQRLMPAFEQFRHPSQAGCVPKYGADHVHLQLEAYSYWAARQKRSFCVLFSDIASAYYKTVRALIVGGDCTDLQLAKIFSDHGWSPDMFHEFLASLSEPCSFVQAQVSGHQQCQALSCLTASWFALRQSHGTLTHTSHGTRPGDPLADLLFGFLFSRLCHKIQSQLDLAGLLETFPIPWIPAAVLDPEEVVAYSPCMASWADDLYIATSVRSASTVLSVARTLASIAVDCAASLGLQLNLGPGKTVVVVVPRGAGTHALKRDLAMQSEPRLDFDTRTCGVTSISISCDYIHLGTLFDGKGHHSEIKRRSILSMPLAKQLRRPVFGKPSVSLPIRSTLFKSYVLSKLMFNFATWHFATLRDQNAWVASLLKMYGTLLPFGFRGPGCRALDILVQTAQTCPMVLAAKLRLALFRRILELDLPTLWSVLLAAVGHGGWLDQIAVDLQYCWRLVPDFPCWPPTPCFAVESLCSLFVERPAQLTALAKAVERRYDQYLGLWKSLQRFRSRWFQHCESVGVNLVRPDIRESVEPTFACLECQKGFATFHGFTSHLYQVHNMRNLARRFAITSLCRACLTQYANRESLIHHLKHLQTGCLIRLVQTVQPLTSDEVSALDHAYAQEQRDMRKQVRRRKFRCPPFRVPGPLRPPVWRTLVTDGLCTGLDTPEDGVIPWLRQVWTSVQALDLSATVATLLLQLCDALRLRGVVAFVCSQLDLLPVLSRLQCCLHFETCVSEWIALASVPSGLPLASASATWLAITGGLDWRLLFQVRVPGHSLSASASVRPCPAWSSQTLATYHVVKQMQLQHATDLRTELVWPTLTKAVCPHTVVLAHLFSGCRQDGFFLKHAVQQGLSRGLEVRVLLIDLEPSNQYDMLDDKKFQQIWEHVLLGSFAGVLLTPPSETWTASSARIPTDIGNSPGSRVARHADAPWCIDGLTTAELRQVDMANALLFAALLLALACLSAGVRFVLEHACVPNTPDLPSIWTTWPVQWLLRHPSVQQVLVHPSQHSAAHLLVGWMPGFQADMCSFAQNARHSSLQPSGQDEYVFNMSFGLAVSFLNEVERHWSHGRPSRDVPETLMAFISDLDAEHENTRNIP